MVKIHEPEKKGLPPPTRGYAKSIPRMEMEKNLLRMETGESFLIEHPPEARKRVLRMLSEAARTTGTPITTRSINKGTRVWKLKEIENE